VSGGTAAGRDAARGELERYLAARLPARERYELLTSLVVPRPIGWVSTRSADGTPNLAPFSYFSALSHDPALVSVSVGHRRDDPKDTLANVRARGAFCVNVVDAAHLETMNATSADVAPDVDEFALAGVPLAETAELDAPHVADAPAVLGCRLFREVDLGAAPNTLLIGEVVVFLVRAGLPRVDGTACVDTAALDPVGRLWGAAYRLGGEIRVLPRPRAGGGS
jgi:flavin reductase (DIM6/NTAB) family NADH-FMN oxidoreductase RutF